VDLGDRGRADRNRIDRGKEPLERGLEAALHLRANGLEWQRRQAVLEPQQIEGGLLADDVRPRRKRLAQLDSGRADVLERGCVIGKDRKSTGLNSSHV